MYKNQLQELAQRSCFNLPAYACIREGPDHAPRFKATVNFNGENFESPTFCSTLRQAEHGAAEVALNELSKKGPSKALAARVLDETGLYKNLLQETAHRAGLKLPVYTTVRSGPGHIPVFSCTVELTGMSFTGETAKTKKQAQKNAAMTAWSALKKLSKSGASLNSSPSTLSEAESNDEQEQVTVACYLSSLQPPETKNSSLRFQNRGPGSAPRQRDIRQYVGNRSLFSLQHRNWAHSEVSPEVSMFQAWLGERSYHNQNHLMLLSALPTYSRRPHIIPFIHSVIQSDPRKYFLSQDMDPTSLVPGINPVLYFSIHPVHVPVKSISPLEEKQLGEEWPSGGDSNHSVASASSNGAINILGSLNCYSERRPRQRLDGEDEEKNGRLMPNGRFSNQLGSNHIIEQYTSPRFTDTRLRRQTISTDNANSPLQYPNHSDSLLSNSSPQALPDVNSATLIKGYLPSSFAAPVMVRTAANSYPVTFRPENSNTCIPTLTPPPRRGTVSACSRRPRLEGMRYTGVMPPASFIAPPVHIRSVVPVCSAPPAKAPPSPIQERLFYGVDKNEVESNAETSVQSLDFGTLHM